MNDAHITLSIVSNEGFANLQIETDGEPLPPIIALAFGRALVAASQVLAVAEINDDADEPETNDEQPETLPTYPRSPRTL
jgi:hypothetical protein